MKPAPHHHSAFSLVEVTLALGVAAFALVAIFGLLPVGLNSNQASIEQTAATSIATGIISDLRTTPITSTTSTRYGITIPTTGSATHTVFIKEDGTAAGAQDANANPSQNPRYRATLVFTVPPAKTAYFGQTSPTATQGTSTVVRLLLTWPALTDLNASQAPTHYTGSFETVIAMDRN
jgi:uncharacterized protein (TIGR02598 family)